MKTTHGLTWLLIFFFTFETQAQSTWFVDLNATGSQSGTSWNDAFVDIQDAIDAASANDTVFIAAGAYKPTTITGGTANNRDKAFVLKEGLKMYGGFAGNEMHLGQRNPDHLFDNNATILSGDLGNANDSSDNSFHVVVAINCTNSTILDGLIISYGNADDSSTNVIGITMTNRNFGGGIYATNADLTINKCKISHNLAYSGGAGLYNVNCGSGTEINHSVIEYNTIWGSNSNDFGGGGIFNENSHPEISETEIEHNVIYNAQGGGGIRNVSSNPTLNLVSVSFNESYNGDGGAGIYNASSSSAQITNSTISNNTTTNQGGGMYSDNSSSTIEDCDFWSNRADDGGGAMENDGGSNVVLINVDFQSNVTNFDGGAIQNWKSSPTIENAFFGNNEAGRDGGAIFNYNDCSPKITNTHIYNNLAQRNGGGLYNRRNCNPIVTNALFEKNHAGSRGGGLYTVESNGSPCSPVLTNVTIVNNDADTSGGGGFDDGMGNPKLRNSIVQGNSAPNNGDIDAPSALVATALLRVIITTDYYAGGATLPVAVTTPLFVNPAAANYELSNGSFAINKGDKSLFNAGKTPDLSGINTDLRGAKRIMGTNIDLGAYEVCMDTAEADVSISVSPADYVPIGTPLTFTAHASGAGSNPEFIWYINSTPVFGEDSTLEGVAGNRFQNGDVIEVIMIPSDKCAMPRELVSNTVGLIIFTSVPELSDKSNAIRIYPNPNHGTFYLHSEEAGLYQMVITDMMGREVFRNENKTLNRETRIDLPPSIKSGLHIVRFWKNNELYDSQKLLID